VNRDREVQERVGLPTAEASGENGLVEWRGEPQAVRRGFPIDKET